MRMYFISFIILFTCFLGSVVVDAAPTDTDWKAISAGGQNTCGIKNDGTAWCWGKGSDGERGDGLTTEIQATPSAVINTGISGSKWTMVNAGASLTCGLRDDGTAWCWGWGYDGEAGDGLKTEV